LQLALLRHPGMSLAQLLQDRGEVPVQLLEYVAAQLGLPESVLAGPSALLGHRYTVAL
jgi:hypothetical protein